MAGRKLRANSFIGLQCCLWRQNHTICIQNCMYEIGSTSTIFLIFSLFLSLPLGRIYSNVKKKYCQINALVDVAYAFIKCALHFHSKMKKKTWAKIWNNSISMVHFQIGKQKYIHYTRINWRPKRIGRGTTQAKSLNLHEYMLWTYFKNCSNKNHY